MKTTEYAGGWNVRVAALLYRYAVRGAWYDKHTKCERACQLAITIQAGKEDKRASAVSASCFHSVCVSCAKRAVCAVCALCAECVM